jgi:hypothetical protein
MSFSKLKEKYKEQYQAHDAEYYNIAYPYLIFTIMIVIVLIMIAGLLLIYQLKNRPISTFYAKNSKGEQRLLGVYAVPNFLPETITRFASKAATVAYTFSFNNIEANLNLAKPYFTESGWEGYRASVSGVINNVSANQLFVNSIVYGTPVISNQGELPDKGYTWRVQIPLLVVYESANSSSTQKYIVILTIVKVPTHINPRGIGVDQFVMSG